MAWSDFFNNMREALQKAEQEQKTPAQSGANTSLNEILRPNIQRPEITYGAHSAERNTPKKKTYQQVWGFEQDKVNYGDERNGDNLNWRSLTVLNNDTGDEVKFDVGYDTDGRISGVRDYKPDGTTMGYYGKDLVSNFFMSNFDRDATDYTFFDEGSDEGSDDGTKYVLFDSKHDGAFIPSESLNMKRGSQRVPVIREQPDKPSVSFEDSVDMVYDEMAAGRGTVYAPRDGEKENAAYNGHLEPMEIPPITNGEYDDFTSKRPAIMKMVSAWTMEDDPDKRQQILRDYDAKYGFTNNPISSRWVEQLSWHDYGDKNDHDAAGARFDYFGRVEFLDSIDKDIAFVEDVFNPYHKA